MKRSPNDFATLKIVNYLRGAIAVIDFATPKCVTGARPASDLKFPTRGE